jgi:tRNA nucleotidyltransferase (CCA-adding enzyme)
MREARQCVADLSVLLQQHFNDDLLGLCLYGSLAAGGFIDGRSDLDLFAVVENEVDDDRVEELRTLHADYVACHPEWEERVEVAYVSRSVVSTFGGLPAGRIAVISPGEPLHLKDIDKGW